MTYSFDKAKVFLRQCAPDGTLSAYDPDRLKLSVCNDAFYLGLDPSTFLRRLDLSFSLGKVNPI
jgi:hypothetical protein